MSQKTEKGNSPIIPRAEGEVLHACPKKLLEQEGFLI